MAISSRSAKHSVSYRLRTESHRFEFVQAVRLLELIGSTESKPRRSVGGNPLPIEECVRLAAAPSLRFPPCEIDHLQVTDPVAAAELYGAKPPKPTAEVTDPLASDDPGRREERRTAELQSQLAPKLTVNFMGLFGPTGVLPQHDTQRIINTGNKKNPERDFLDVFNHRILSLFYRASIKYRLPFAYESAYRSAESKQHLVSRVLYSIAGMGTEGLLGRLLSPDELAIEFGGVFGHQPKNASSLQRMLCSYFQLPIHVIQFVGQWLTLSEDNKSLMPMQQAPLGRNCQLGSSFIIGDRIWDVSGKIRLRIGPLDLEQFQSLLPGTHKLTETAQITRWYVGNQFDFDIQLELQSQCVPEIQLGMDGNAQLGFNTWLITNAPNENKLEAVFTHPGLPLDNPLAEAA